MLKEIFLQDKIDAGDFMSSEELCLVPVITLMSLKGWHLKITHKAVVCKMDPCAKDIYLQDFQADTVTDFCY